MLNQKNNIITLISDISNIRIDKYLNDKLSKEYNISRTNIQTLINDKKIAVNDRFVNSSYKLKLNDLIKINLEIKHNESNLIKQKVDFEIIYEDNDILVINKPNGLVVHPGVGNSDNTLVNGLLYLYDNFNDIDQNLRPGIVHRLDKNTTGLMIVSKTDIAHKNLTEQFKNREIIKEYWVLVWDVIKEDKGRIEAPIGRSNLDRKKMVVTCKNSKQAITNFEVLKRFENATLLKCLIETGRTHQIRVHMQYINHPVIGDDVYGFKKDQNDDFKQYLHSKRICFTHPLKNNKLEFEIDLPKEFLQKIKELNNE